MSSIRFYNARILDVKNMKIIEGELHVKENKISYVGDITTNNDFEQNIDCKGNLLMPGFKNVHTHSAMTFLRSYCDDASLEEWLFNKVLPLESNLTGDDVYWLSKLAVLEYLQSGITTNFDMYVFPFDAARASYEMGYRTVFTGCFDYYGADQASFTRMYDEMNSLNPLISYKVGFHSVYTLDEEYLREIAKFAKERNLPTYSHMCETKAEVENCRKAHNGLSPIEYIDKLGLIDNGGSFYHCVHLTDNDIKILKEHNCKVVTCPSSNSKLASGIPNLEKILNNGIEIGIGTDGPASNNSLDMFKEMFLASVLAKLSNNNPESLKASDIVKMATYSGANVLGMPEISSLEEGNLADIIMIDLNMPNMQPINNIISNLVYAGNKINVKMTLINGKILYSDGKFNVGIEPEVIYAKCKEIAWRLQNK